MQPARGPPVLGRHSPHAGASLRCGLRQIEQRAAAGPAAQWDKYATARRRGGSRAAPGPSVLEPKPERVNGGQWAVCSPDGESGNVAGTRIRSSDRVMFKLRVLIGSINPSLLTPFVRVLFSFSSFVLHPDQLTSLFLNFSLNFFSSSHVSYPLDIFKIQIVYISCICP